MSVFACCTWACDFLTELWLSREKPSFQHRLSTGQTPQLTRGLQANKPMKTINEFDLAFVVDTTSSMGGLIEAAQKQLVEVVDALATTSDIDMRFGVVEYRDHPPQDTLVSRAYPFTADLKRAKKNINGLRVNGGGDAPEAVFAGIVTALEQLRWRKHARRIAVLVGDAPPHGVGFGGDAFPRGCPSGETMESVAAKCEETSVTLYAIGLTRAVKPYFSLMSELTGGQYFEANQGKVAIAKLKEVLNREFGQLSFDREVFSAWNAANTPTVDSLADAIGATPPNVASSVSRLQSRELL